jgi:hypothetical protein
MDKVKINKAIDGLGLSVDNKNTLKEALNQDYETDISNLETRVDTINTELSTAKTDISTAKTDISTAKTDISTAKTDISNLETRVDNFINANEIIELGVGVDEETKAANIAKLGDTQRTFFTNINHAYGTASWLPANGGNAFIITDEGHAVKYTISKDGEVTKGKEFTLKDFTSELNNKVDKVEGKQLSSNDYTTAEKNKLANLQNYTLPAATKTTLGGVKAITNIVNVDTETATAASLAGVVNTLLNQLRAAGIIQL